MRIFFTGAEARKSEVPFLLDASMQPITAQCLAPRTGARRRHFQPLFMEDLCPSPGRLNGINACDYLVTIIRNKKLAQRKRPVFLYVPDVDALYEEIMGRGIKARSPPEDF
jgi:hypothetical protein